MRRRPRTDIRNMPPFGTELELAVVPVPFLVEVLKRADDTQPPAVYAVIEAPGGGGDRRTFRVEQIRKEVERRQS